MFSQIFLQHSARYLKAAKDFRDRCGALETLPGATYLYCFENIRGRCCKCCLFGNFATTQSRVGEKPE